MSDIPTLAEYLQQRYGKLGTPKRDEFERKSKAFTIGELIKEERKKERKPI